MRIVLALMLGMSMLSAVTAQAQTCTKQTITGTYGVLCSAQNPGTPMAILGTVAIGQNRGVMPDFAGTGKMNFAGAIFPMTLNGAASLNSDCTGTVSFPSTGNPVIPLFSLDFHVVDGGREIRGMVVTGPTVFVLTCSFRPIDRLAQ